MAESQSSGAYGEETLEPGLSVRAGSTAIPVFVGEFGDALDTVTAVASWPDFTQALEAAGAKDDSATTLSAVLRGYFANGGGRCYLANTTGRTLAAALQAVEQHSDVTILVAPGLWDQGAQTAGEWARALTVYAAAHRAMAILHVDRDHTPAQASDAVSAWGIDAA